MDDIVKQVTTTTLLLKVTWMTLSLQLQYSTYILIIIILIGGGGVRADQGHLCPLREAPPAGPGRVLCSLVWSLQGRRYA